MGWNHFDDVVGDSPLAKEIPGRNNDNRSSRQRRKSERVSRVVAHMTGGSIVKKAIDHGRDPVEKCLDYYTSKGTSSHYLIGYDGTVYQMTDDHLRVGHVGVTTKERAEYLNGGWARGNDVNGEKVSPQTVELWHAAWPHYKSPQHLFPSRSINDVSVGVEMPPCGYNQRGGWKPLDGQTPMRPGLRHTREQHLMFAALAVDVASRWKFDDGWWNDPKGGPRSPQLPGHEDVDLYGRSQRSGGWDPGALRTSPWWDWDYVISSIKIIRLSTMYISSVKSVVDKMLRALSLQ